MIIVATIKYLRSKILLLPTKMENKTRMIHNLCLAANEKSWFTLKPMQLFVHLAEHTIFLSHYDIPGTLIVSKDPKAG
jgi:hypothetical protein